MSKNTCKMIGIITMIISVFLLIGGLYLPQTDISNIVTTSCLIAGVLLLAVGIVFYSILKTD
ncbi:hypothetical protein [Butyrivibrio sp. WCD2001]|uniref:hypothetical protein n=1 Tax=Butyrivibrio sp. WCD2001 TaxID=1280681 RepID=UPI000407228F|nr:hypothetical protein [Butyrivibrio sp. WCD2001]